MSSELLATLRDMEDSKILSCVNTSPLPYDELYRRRARAARGFVSDYGVTHSTLAVGPLTAEEADDLLSTRLDCMTDRGELERRYIREVALSESGGLPSVFLKAARYLCDDSTGPGRLTSRAREHRRVLPQLLAEGCERLLAYDLRDQSRTLTAAVAQLFLGRATKREIALLREHRWANLIMNAERDELRADAVGVAALRSWRRTAESETIAQAPRSLYRDGDYDACRRLILQTGQHAPLLSAAAEMLKEVYGDTPTGPYFQCVSTWKKVGDLALHAQSLCSQEWARVEFTRWSRIAAVHSMRPPAQKAAIQRFLVQEAGRGADGLDDAVIYLGLRILAVQADRNPVTKAYSWIPVIEDVLRHYVVFVCHASPNGLAFEGVSDEEISRWWRHGDPFDRPSVADWLTGAPLALLGAVLSKRAERPLFVNKVDYERCRAALDLRNVLGHYVTAPSERVVVTGLSIAKRLFERMVEVGGAEIGLEQLRAWSRAPTRFLEEEAGGGGLSIDSGSRSA